jgi:hypothetical protein
MAHHWEQYIHTLIPDGQDFASQPQQVASFFDNLAKLGGTPLKAKLRVMKPSGKFRTGTNATTGETISFPMSEHIPLGDFTEIPQALEGLNHYNVILDGQGPSRLSPFGLWTPASDGTIIEFSPLKTYDFQVACCLRAEVVSTSYWDAETYQGDETLGYEVPFFGEPWDSTDRTGIFHDPSTGAMIKVPNTGCARFWVEFEFGKWLFPRIEGNFDVLEPSIVRCAELSFGSKFVQGCHYY